MPKPSEIARMLDHSMLQPWLTEEDIRKGCAVAIKYHTAAVCARPCDMKLVAALLKGTDIAPCTVIGFPHGAHLTAVKVYEAEQAILDGCAELDMVINICRLKAGDDAYVENDIRAVAEAAHRGGAILKVIIETCCLTDEEKVRACQLAEKAGADFVKTSTGYGSHGATPEDVALMRAAVSDRVKVKAAGGMRTLDAILAVREAGADRCGVSATEAIMKEAEERLSAE